MHHTDTRKLVREKLLFRYTSALEQGDAEALASILHEAETDPVLAQMIDEINDVYSAEASLSLARSIRPPVNGRVLPAQLSTAEMQEKPMYLSPVLVKPTPSSNRPLVRIPLTLVAAILAFALIGGLSFMMMMNNDGPPRGVPGAAQQTDATMTFTPTLLPPLQGEPISIVVPVEMPPDQIRALVLAALSDTLKQSLTLPLHIQIWQPNGVSVTVNVWSEGGVRPEPWGALPPPTVLPPTVTRPEATSTPLAVSPADRFIVYIIAPGETLERIAQRFGVSVGQILEVNRLTPDSPVTVGQPLIIPLPGVEPSTIVVLTPTPIR